jgi:hypothetical protein
VHLEDFVYNEREFGVAGVLVSRPFDEPERRAWIFRTVGQGQDVEYWRSFVAALGDIGYDDALSIENGDPLLPGKEGVREAARFIRDAMRTPGEGSILSRLSVTGCQKRVISRPSLVRLSRSGWSGSFSAAWRLSSPCRSLRRSRR